MDFRDGQAEGWQRELLLEGAIAGIRHVGWTLQRVSDMGVPSLLPRSMSAFSECGRFVVERASDLAGNAVRIYGEPPSGETDSMLRKIGMSAAIRYMSRIMDGMAEDARFGQEADALRSFAEHLRSDAVQHVCDVVDAEERLAEIAAAMDLPAHGLRV